MKWLYLLVLIISSPVFATVYQTPTHFFHETFSSPPKPQVLWITKSIKPQVERIMAHKVNFLRIRYWGKGKKTVWILDEIGKERPITIGIVIENNRIDRIKVLEFRESRGDEIQYPFFTDQFHHARLQNDLELDRHINGISGATLSVRALTKISRLALFFHQQTSHRSQP